MRSTHVGAWRPLCAALGGAALAALLWPSLHALGATRQSAPGLSTNYDFVRLVLHDGGWPASSSNVTVLTQWLRAEEPVDHWWNRDNPLNNGLGDGGGSGLGTYGSLVTAAYEVAQNLQSSYAGYPQVARDLAHSQAPAVTERAIWRSDWASGHYGWGADWETTPVASVAAPPWAWRDPSSCTKPVPHVVEPCDRGLTTTGPGWHWSSLRTGGEQLWAALGRGSAPSSATWAARVRAGTYELDAYIPSQFADAVAAYVVVDARGGHRVVLDQEPYSDVWVRLGDFAAAGPSTPLRVVLRTPASGASGTYLSAAAMRFTPVAPSRARSGEGPPRAAHRLVAPSAPLDVTAVPGAASAVVSWLAPSKDGGAPVASYLVTALPSGRTCRATGASANPTCTIGRLRDGVAYHFVVRARTRVGVSRASAPSFAVRPVQSTTLGVTVRGTPTYEGVVVLRATVTPATSGGLVLFALNGSVLPRCGSAYLVHGHASCAARLLTIGHDQLLVTYSGNGASSGSESLSTLVVTRRATTLHAAADPAITAAMGVVTVRAWGLPRAAVGKVIFTVQGAHLCTSGVRGGGASCRFRVHLRPGAYEVLARYPGTHIYRGSSAVADVRVLSATTRP